MENKENNQEELFYTVNLEKLFSSDSKNVDMLLYKLAFILKNNPYSTAGEVISRLNKYELLHAYKLMQSPTASDFSTILGIIGLICTGEGDAALKQVDVVTKITRLISLLNAAAVDLVSPGKAKIKWENFTLLSDVKSEDLVELIQEPDSGNATEG